MFVQSVLSLSIKCTFVPRFPCVGTVYPCQYTPIDSYVGNMVFDAAI